MDTRQQLLRFLMVGGLNTAVGYTLYALFIFLGITYGVALLLSTVLGVLFNFKTTGTIVFNNAHNSLFYKFVGVYAVTYLFNLGLIKLIQSVTNNLYGAGFLALVPVAIVTFLLNKFLVFKDVYEIN